MRVFYGGIPVRNAVLPRITSNFLDSFEGFLLAAFCDGAGAWFATFDFYRLRVRQGHNVVAGFDWQVRRVQHREMLTERAALFIAFFNQPHMGTRLIQ